LSATKAISSLASPATPPIDWTKRGSREHVAQFYSNDTYLIDTLSEIIGPALGAGDSAIIVATRAHRQALGRSLKSRGLDLAHITKQGRYIALDAAETLAKFMVDGTPDRARFANVIGGLVERAEAKSQRSGRGPTVFGEMVALLWEGGNTLAALQLEQLWNELAREDLLSANPNLNPETLSIGAPLQLNHFLSLAGSPGVPPANPVMDRDEFCGKAGIDPSGPPNA